MKFLVTANVEDRKEVNELGIIAGVTTNPSLIAKEKRDIHEVISEIVNIVIPRCAEVMCRYGKLLGRRRIRKNS